jgi:putative NADPH-quinone reductase
MKKNVLIMLGHPYRKSFCNSLAEHYKEGVERAGGSATFIRLNELSFDPILHKGYSEVQKLEDDLVNTQRLITEADHLVFVYPVWWGGPPALLKGFIDRVILPGFGFRFEEGKLAPKKLLKKKSARIIETMDAPGWFYKLFFGAPGDKMMKRTVLNFCGVRPVRFTYVDRLRTRSEVWRRQKLEKITKLGERDTL